MITKILVIIPLGILFTATAIAQPLDYASELNIPSSPQNYLYGIMEYPEITPIEPLYDMRTYKKGQIISTEKIVYSENLGFTPGYCTSYIAHKRPDIFLGLGNNKISGDAKDWLHSAKSSGLSTGKEPHVGAIAVFRPGKGASSLGHVGYVEYVGDNGMIVVSDMNFRGKYMVTTRVISSTLAAGYIY